MRGYDYRKYLNLPWIETGYLAPCLECDISDVSEKRHTCAIDIYFQYFYFDILLFPFLWIFALPLIEIAIVESESVSVNALIFSQLMSPKSSPIEKCLKWPWTKKFDPPRLI